MVVNGWIYAVHIYIKECSEMFGKMLYDACLASDEYQRLCKVCFEVVEMIAENAIIQGMPFGWHKSSRNKKATQDA
jgi:hypothetical protein